MKKFLLLTGVACLFAASAEAAITPYVSAKVSYDFNKVKDKMDLAGNKFMTRLNKELFGSHVALGARAGYMRGELELNNSGDVKRNWVVTKGKNFSMPSFSHFRLYKHSYMANVYFDYLTCTPWTPYVGAGMGVSYLKADFGTTAKSVHTLGWQVMAGLTYDINSHWALDLGYRYADNGRIRKVWFQNDLMKTKITSREHDILFGVRYAF